jgi:Skp family chaperone for outer membrane proteins
MNRYGQYKKKLTQAMKYVTALYLSLALLLAGSASAQSASAQSIAVVNFQLLISEQAEAKMKKLKKAYDIKNQKLNKKLAVLQLKWINLQDSQKGNITGEQLQPFKKQESIINKEREQLVKSSREQENEIIQAANKNTTKAIISIAREINYSLVLPLSNVIVVNKTDDITESVREILNKQRQDP